MFLTKSSTQHSFNKIVILALAMYFLSCTLAFAADVVISPSTGSYTPGQTFTVSVRVNPGGTSVNAVEANLKFDPAVLSVVNVSKTGSVFSLWTTEPTFSNSAGTIAFGGGSPTPFTAQSNLVSVTLKAVSAGSGSLTVSNASVLAADGRGTDVYQKSTNGTFTIAASPTPPPPTEEPVEEPKPPVENEEDEDESEGAIVFGDPPRAPEVGSQAFLDPELWYSITDGVFTWELPFDVNVVAVMISTSSDNQPELTKTAVFDPPIEEFAVNKDIIKDGIQYLSIKYKNQVGWGTVLNRKILVDTTPPENFTVDVRVSNSPTGFPQLNFEAKDLTSGIERYEMTIADGEPITITPDEAKLGYILKELEDGTYTVKVIAYDRAGNVREATAPVQITAGWVKPSTVVVETSVWDYFTARNLIMALLLVIVLLQFIYIWYDRKQGKLREDKLRRETREIQDQMEKIFSALRDEIYDQINLITKRPRLSKKEKEAVEGLNQALEVSETLIEKEINDVKSILK